VHEPCTRQNTRLRGDPIHRMPNANFDVPRRTGTIIRLTTVALVSAFAVMVQRDTFVRRWLITPPAPSPTPLQDRIVPEITFDTASFTDAVAHLARVSGSPITNDLPKNLVYGRAKEPDQRFRRTFQNYSVRRILWALVDHWYPPHFAQALDPNRGFRFDTFKEQGDKIAFYNSDDSLQAMFAFDPSKTSVRTYAVADLLPPSDTPAPAPYGAGAMDNHSVVARSAARNELRWRAFGTAPFPGDDPTLLYFGSRLVVAGPPHVQRAISDMLADLREDKMLRAWVFGGVRYDP
jgi:hypothetical protein